MWMPRSLPEKRVGGNGLVAVAIDRDKSSQIALRWAIDNLLVKGQTVILIHVNLKSSLSSHSSSPKMNQFVDSKDVFLPFRCFCTRKDISCKDVMLEDTDVAKALTEYVTQTLIETLIVGGSTKGGFLRMLKCDDSIFTVYYYNVYCRIYRDTMYRLRKSINRRLAMHGELGRREGSIGEEGGGVMVWESEEGTTSVIPGERWCVGVDGGDGDCSGLTREDIDGGSRLMGVLLVGLGLVGLWIG
ncbi:hypothetical protein DKX38_027574 [Salix brachista]|uniref:RING-type E3 ubiquitin transferase n=1 Tax=Salix brachista TaxID=2182728 RepID=A0A5N5J398_9ROSI|nr:hypothetical protein DKX38_027574 [Salix brachista]